jgi:hypothetical protein
MRYDLSFWAKADTARQIRLNSQRNSPDWRNYGLSTAVAIGTEWKQYAATFQANETVDDARIEFFMGNERGDVWLDDVRLAEHPADLFRRDFTNGTVLLNATRQRQTVVLEPGGRMPVPSITPGERVAGNSTASPARRNGTWPCAKTTLTRSMPGGRPRRRARVGATRRYSKWCPVVR